MEFVKSTIIDNNHNELLRNRWRWTMIKGLYSSQSLTQLCEDATIAIGHHHVTKASPSNVAIILIVISQRSNGHFAPPPPPRQ
jgi:hypothetical protein